LDSSNWRRIEELVGGAEKKSKTGKGESSQKGVQEVRESGEIWGDPRSYRKGKKKGGDKS